MKKSGVCGTHMWLWLCCVCVLGVCVCVCVRCVCPQVLKKGEKRSKVGCAVFCLVT